MSTDWKFYLAAIPAVILVGLSKGGFQGLSALSLPLLALVMSPVRAAAVMLPVLIMQDWVSVWAFRREFNARILLILIPAALVGIMLGWGLSAHVSEAAVRLAVGTISVVFVGYSLLRRRLAPDAKSEAKVFPGLFWGAVAGFVSFISHTGSPPFQVYVLPQKLPPAVFAGTAVIFFATVNLLKVPPYVALGQFSRENLVAAATLAPIAIASTFAGVWLVRRVAAQRFFTIVLTLTFLVGLKLIWDGGAALAAESL